MCGYRRERFGRFEATVRSWRRTVRLVAERSAASHSVLSASPGSVSERVLNSVGLSSAAVGCDRYG